MPLSSYEQKTKMFKQIAIAITSSLLDIESMLRRVSPILRRSTGSDVCLIYTMGEGEFLLQAASGLSENNKIRLKRLIIEDKISVSGISTSWFDDTFQVFTHLKETTQPVATIPLVFEQKLVGVINLRVNNSKNTEKDIIIPESVIELLTPAVESALRHDKLKRQEAQINTLSQISKTITSDLYLEDILHTILEMTAERMNFKICSIMLLNEAKTELVIKATQSTSISYIKKPNVKLTESVAGRAVMEKKPITVTDVLRTPRYQYPDIARKEGLCSLISLPLEVKKEIIGVLNCYTQTPHVFTEDEIAFCTALASQTAIYIQNSRLMVHTAVLQEMHHRVKNSLQTIASLLRLQIRLGKFENPKAVLERSMLRIQSIATVHELLSSDNLDNVSLKKLADNLLTPTTSSLLPDDRGITTQVIGEDLFLPSGQATYVALILNELIQNAVEHGFKGNIGNHLAVQIDKTGDDIILQVINDGEKLAEGFDIKTNQNLGLQIVQSLVYDNLMGSFMLETIGEKTYAKVKFNCKN